MPVASEHKEKIRTAREDSTTTCPRPSRTNLPCRPTSTSTPSPVLEAVPGMLALEMITQGNRFCPRRV